MELVDAILSFDCVLVSTVGANNFFLREREVSLPKWGMPQEIAWQRSRGPSQRQKVWGCPERSEEQTRSENAFVSVWTLKEEEIYVSTAPSWDTGRKKKKD